MNYPGQRVQIDVKFVPSSCLVNEAKGKRFYQYTAIDEYSRWRYVEAFEEHSTYSSAVFLRHFLERFPMPVECVQTDNGTEFTKRFSTSRKETLTLFQRVLQEYGIRHKLIRPWIVNSKLNNFFKVILPVLNWCQVTERGMKSVIVKPIHIISKPQF